MPSRLAWLDFAESDRDVALRVIDLFRDRTTVDELGFSPIRDAFADFLFPGTSTIQTRARYFLFIPWIMRRIERQALPVPELARRAARAEDELVGALQAHGDQTGIIGRLAGDSLKRKPSSVYWRGLQIWGIRLFPGSIDQYLRRISRRQPAASRVLETDDREPVSGQIVTWHPGLPPEPPGFRSSVSFELTLADAEFLRDRVQTSCPRSLLAWLLRHAEGPAGVRYAWEHPLAPSLPADLRRALEHAEAFSTCIWGAAVLYSLRVAQLKGADGPAAALKDTLASWIEHVEDRRIALARWDRAEFWTLVRQLNPRLPVRTQQFADQWLGVALKEHLTADGLQDPAVLALLTRREEQIKGPRARLRPDNHRGRDLWNGSAQIAQIDFRWGSGQIILDDILRGLGRSEEGADA